MGTAQLQELKLFCDRNTTGLFYTVYWLTASVISDKPLVDFLLLQHNVEGYVRSTISCLFGNAIIFPRWMSRSPSLPPASAAWSGTLQLVVAWSMAKGGLVLVVASLAFVLQVFARNSTILSRSKRRLRYPEGAIFSVWHDQLLKIFTIAMRDITFTAFSTLNIRLWLEICLMQRIFEKKFN